MPRTRVKICGICRSSDAILAAEAGADALGMVFCAASKRAISISLAAEIVRAIPAFVAAVGLFADSDEKTIRDVVAQTGITTLQLHGNESPNFVSNLAPLRVVKAVRVRSADDLAPWCHPPVNLVGLLLETPHDTELGGTGVANNFAALAQLKSQRVFDGLPPIIIAGGLSPQNVGSVVKLLRPHAVDVSTGVEQNAREKSPEKIRAFIDAVYQADQELT